MVRVAYFNINFLDFDHLTEQVDELKHTRELPHVSQFILKCRLLWWLWWVRVNHLLVRPLSRHDGKDVEV